TARSPSPPLSARSRPPPSAYRAPKIPRPMAEISPSLYRAGEGDPVVLLHGFTGHWSHWKPVLADLVARFGVIAPTFSGIYGGPACRGAGAGPAPAGSRCGTSCATVSCSRRPTPST